MEVLSVTVAVIAVPTVTLIVAAAGAKATPDKVPSLNPEITVVPRPPGHPNHPLLLVTLCS